MKASLLLTTYNQPEHLALVFAGLERQTRSDFEVLVCDDGSDERTAKVVEAFKANADFPVTHVWQEDDGFRKCRILNKGLRQARGDIVIFIDGDCVPNRYFVHDHIEQQREGRYLAGRRVELGRAFSEQLTPEAVRAGFFDGWRWSLLRDCQWGDSRFFHRSLRVGSPRLRRLFGMHQVDDLKGCNFSVPRKIMEELNGFDETYEGYGREDTDVEIRMQNYGLTIRSLKGLANQFHVWHPQRGFTPENEDRLEALRQSGRFRCEVGLEQLSRATEDIEVVR